MAVIAYAGVKWKNAVCEPLGKATTARILTAPGQVRSPLPGVQPQSSARISDRAEHDSQLKVGPRLVTRSLTAAGVTSATRRRNGRRRFRKDTNRSAEVLPYGRQRRDVPFGELMPKL